MAKAIDLIEYIVSYATEHDVRLTTVRLVKFVYLADLYFARANDGKTFTGFPWAFVSYGPYCDEVMSEIDRAASLGVITRDTYESRFAESKDYSLFSSHAGNLDRLEDEFPISITSPLKNDLRKYGEDTPALLDHVYFETEPMIAARPGDALDFSAARPLIRPSEVKLNKLPRGKVDLAREHVKRFGEKLSKGADRLRKDEASVQHLKDDAYYRAIKSLDDEDLETGLRGTAKIGG